EARYTGRGGETCVRRDEAIAFAWQDGSPDARIKPGNFHASWEGLLYVRSPGEHRLALHVCGKATLTLAGRTLLEVESDEPRWAVSEPVELAFGHHALHVTFEKTNDEARIALFWSGAEFQREPVTPRFLFHPVERKIDDRFERGEVLASALRCNACHGTADAH